MKAAYSLRRRLLAWVLGASVAAWLVSLAIVVGVAWHETSKVFDDALEETARLALALGADPRDRIASPRAAPALAGESRLNLYYQVIGPDGRVRSRSEDAPEQAFVRGDVRSEHHLNVRADDRYWRVYVERDARSGLTAQVGQPWEERLDLLEEMAEKLAWPALALLVLLGAVCWLAIRGQLAPLEHTAAGIAAKSPQDLSPVADTGQPRELRPIVDALNALLQRLGTALASERRFTADAAHELRTPLAALRMRVQLLERQQAAPAEALRTLREDVDRSTALVESLLALARLDPAQDTLVRRSTDLAALFDGLDRTTARARGIQVTQAVEVPALQAEPVLLASALRGLLDNAVRYGRPGGRVHLAATPLPGGGVRLGVHDDGPGVAPADRARLGERFFRVLGTGQSGNGLGLSIVARIAALHGATLHFADGLDGQGLAVLLDFPAR